MSLPAKTLRARIVLIHGDESVLRDMALSELLASHGIQADDFDFETVYGDVSPPDSWIASVSTSPFLSERRVMLVRHAGRCDPKDHPKLDLRQVPESGLLILVGDEESGDENRQRRIEANLDRWAKLIAKADGAEVKVSATPAKAEEVIRTTVAQRNKQISAKAVSLLVEMSGGSLSRALDEVEKLTLFVGETEQIRESDVATVVVPSREWNVYRMFDAILAGDPGTALRQLYIVTANNARPEDQAFRTILPTLSRQVRLIWQARILLDARESPGRCSDATRARLPERGILQEREFAQRNAMRHADGISYRRLQRAIEVINDADSRLKGILPAVSSIDTLERLVIDLSNALRPRAVAA